MKSWLLNGATTTGESHHARGKGSDDSAASQHKNGWTAIVVCDGAGSAARAREGADFVAMRCSELLVELSDKITSLGPGHWLNDAVVEIILTIRSELAARAGTYDLSPFHCTLVGALISDHGGFSVHIGDGTILLGKEGLEGQRSLTVHSEPHNGQYANETYFITEPNWIKNLRIKPLGKCDLVILATDGAAATLAEKEVQHSIASEFLKATAAGETSEDRDDAIKDFLLSPYSLSRSADDKTLLIATRTVDMYYNYASISLEPLPDGQLGDASSACEQIERFHFQGPGEYQPAASTFMIRLGRSRTVLSLAALVLVAVFIPFLIQAIYYQATGPNALLLCEHIAAQRVYLCEGSLGDALR